MRRGGLGPEIVPTLVGSDLALQRSREHRPNTLANEPSARPSSANAPIQQPSRRRQDRLSVGAGPSETYGGVVIMVGGARHTDDVVVDRGPTLLLSPLLRPNRGHLLGAGHCYETAEVLEATTEAAGVPTIEEPAASDQPVNNAT